MIIILNSVFFNYYHNFYADCTSKYVFEKCAKIEINETPPIDSSAKRFGQITIMRLT